MNRRFAVMSLAVFFAMAWLPFGQQAFMVEHWMKVGAYIAPIVVFFAFQRRVTSLPAFLDVSFVACLLTSAYLVHQVEEHWVDLLGREYPLYALLNALVARATTPENYGIMTPTAIFYINAGMVWTAGFVAILLGSQRPFPAMAMAGLMLVNGALHLLNGVATQSYNSGLATGALFFLPLSLLFYRALLTHSAASRGLVGLAVLWGALAHVVLFAGLVASFVYNALPSLVYYAILVGWGLLPAFLPKRGAQIGVAR